MRILASWAFLAGLSLILTACGGSNPPNASSSTNAKPTGGALAPPVATVDPKLPAGSPPVSILFDSAYGKVTFTHQKHFERVNGDCSTCHPKVFPQALEALNYGKARHRAAEEYRTSCATCHNVTGTAFAAERKCEKCHAMGPGQ